MTSNSKRLRGGGNGMGESSDKTSSNSKRVQRGGMEESGILFKASVAAKGEGKQYVLKLIRLSQAEFDLPKAYVDWVSKNFRMIDTLYNPKSDGCLPELTFREEPFIDYTVRVHLPNGKIGIMKFGHEEVARKVIKELCVHHHLKDLEGSRIPRLLFVGTWDCLGTLPLFYITELPEPILEPSQVSASELSELLNLIHARGVLLGCTGQFPRLTRVDSKLLLVDMPTAIFEHRKTRFKAELKLLTGLCMGGGD